MESLPKRRTVVEETVAALKSWISGGILGETLPGELQLKDRLGVGRDSVRLALNVLTQEGWLLPTGQGRQRRVQQKRLPLHGGAAGHPLPVTFLSPYPVVHRLTLAEMEETRSHLEEQGRALHFVSPRIFHLKNPGRHLERLVEQHPSAAWVLNVTGEAIQRWFEQRGLPTLLFEMPFAGVNLPFVADNWEEAAFHAGVQLLRHGHHVIGILEYEERRPGLLAEERGLERALADAKTSGRFLVFKDDLTPPSVARSLERAFSLKERPTALVLSRAAQVLTCYSWLLSRGIRVPGDVSLVCLADDSWFPDFHPPLTHYRADARVTGRLLAERVLELIRLGRITRKSIRLHRVYVPGATLGPAPVPSA
jgi:DNA-binding LacI/PurR family transcriptional regulator